MRYILLLLSVLSFKGFAQPGYRTATKDPATTHAYDGSFDFTQLDRTIDKASLIGEQLYFSIPNDGTTPKPFTTMTVEEPTFLYSILATEQKTVLDDPFYGKGWSIHGASVRDKHNRFDYRSYLSYFYKSAVTIFSPDSRNLWVATPYSVLQDRSFTIKDCRNTSFEDGEHIVFTLQDAVGEAFKWSIYEANVTDFPMVHIKRHLTQQRHDFVGKKFYVRGDGSIPNHSFNILDNKEYDNVAGKEYTCINVNFINSTHSETADLFLIFEDDSGYEIAICPPGHELGIKWGSTAYYLSEPEYALFKEQQQTKVASASSVAVTNKTSVKTVKQSNQSRIKGLEKQYGGETAKLIVAGRVELGMTKQICLESWGKPLSFVESQRKGRKTETLRYGVHRWLRFTNGKLTSFSDLR